MLRVTGRTHRVSVSSIGTRANTQSLWPAISADGRVVAFTRSHRTWFPAIRTTHPARSSAYVADGTDMLGSGTATRDHTVPH